MKNLLFITLLVSFHLGAQQSQVDSLLEKMNTYQHDSCRVNQLISTCTKIIELDRKVARRSRVYYHLTNAYFTVGETDKALKTAKKVTPTITFPRYSRITMQRNMDSRIVCYELYEYYHNTGAHRKAYKNLSLMFRKYVAEKCGTGRESSEKHLHQLMIDCLEESGKCKKAARLRKNVYIS